MKSHNVSNATQPSPPGITGTVFPPTHDLATADAGDLVFVCDEIERNYETAENLVLKAVIGVITGIVQQDLATVSQTGTPAWLGLWAPDSRLRQEFQNASGRNVYLRRIQGDADRITDGMIARYRRLLTTTFIRPDRAAVLFEFSWVIRIIRAFRHTAERIGFLPIEPGAGDVARWTIAGDVCTISHDSTGSKPRSSPGSKPSAT